MSAESSLQTSIQQLGLVTQVPLVADCLPTSQCSSDEREESSDPLYVRIGVPLPVTVESANGRILVRGNLDKMNWALYKEIAGGLRKLVAAQLGVEVEALVINELLLVEADHAVQYVEITVPPVHRHAFVSADTQQQVGTYMHVLSGKALPQESSAGAEGVRQAVAIAREVRAAIGGKTLPAICTVSSSGWDAALQLSGKLGDKPEQQASKPEEYVIRCHIDGYIKSKRLVHLLPLSNGEDAGSKRGGRKMVAYGEEEWFASIAASAAERGKVVLVTYRRVVDGKRELLQLVNMEPSAISCVAAFQESAGVV